MSQSVNKKTAYALAIAGCLFLLALAATGWAIAQLRVAQQWVSHSHQVISGCKELLLVCLDCETGQRGYMATGDATFLEPLNKSRHRAGEIADRLQNLTADDEVETARMQKIRGEVKNKLDFIDSIIKSYSRSPDEAIAIIKTYKGKLIMDRIRNLIAESDMWQNQLLKKREAAVASLQVSVGALIAVFTLLEAASLIYTYKLNNAFAEDQRKRTEALEAEIKLRLATEQSLREASEYLARSNQDLQQFAYVASHDLQEPLRAVQGFTTLLAKTYKGQLSEQADGWIEQTVSGAERMRALINGLLQYARVESRGGQMEAIDLNVVVKDALKDLSLLIAETAAEIKVDQSLPTLQGDASQLRLLFVNLINNAIKYRGDRTPKIEISALQITPNWQICVEDNGIGFDMQHQDKIFVLFQRLHSRSQYEGTGIGLALCRRIVERHRGTITAISTVGSGSKFMIKLPINTGAIKVQKVEEIVA